MLSIPLSHFTKSGAIWYQLLYEYGFAQHSLCGFIYITINVFVMQAFMFLSGFFSKNTERARKTSVKGILWPYLVFATIWIIAGHVFNLYGYRHCSYLTPPFALWFLYCLFLYRFLIGYMVRFKYILPASIIMMFVAGFAPFSDFLALGRFFSYLPFFLIGYYLPKEKMEKIQSLRTKPYLVLLLGIVLVVISILLVNFGLRPSWYLLKTNAFSLGVPIWADQLMRLLLLFIGGAWIVFMLNFLPVKRNILSYIGTNTMPIYMFHLPLRQVYRLCGLNMLTMVSLVIGTISAASILHKKQKDWKLILCVVAIAGLAIFLAYDPIMTLVGVCPRNKWLFYILTFGDALLVGFSFASPLWVKIYSLMTDRFYDLLFKRK